jgi:alcohol dehydrogenase
MAYASLLSGVCLAQTGLGSVHGLAQPLGSLFPIPHGVVCGTLLAAATRVNVETMRQREVSNPALPKYAMVGRMLPGAAALSESEAIDRLIETLEEWTLKLSIPTLTQWGVRLADLPNIIRHSRGSSMKTNPILLTDDDINRILIDRLRPTVGHLK